jgi:glycosyltransferase involved in cell wall biosynthesis
MPGSVKLRPDGLPRRALMYVVSVHGGITHHSHYQAEELARRGVDVTMLCSEAYPWAQSDAPYRQLRVFPEIPRGGLMARIGRFLAVIGNHWRLAWEIMRLRPDLVLLEANTEYFALLWIWPHLLLRALGVTYVANFHDPVRKVRYGSRWLHRLELGSLYATLRGGLIHGAPPAEAWIPRWIRMEVVPHGPFPHQAAAGATFDLRELLGIAQGQFVLLAFGLITDYKNLDLLIEAVAATPQADLVIAGAAKTSGERPVQYYRDLAASRGVADRVHIIDRFIPEADVAAYFAGADAAALTYRREFVSQSGVLQLAVLWEKPILASSGEGPLREAVTGYGLGIFVEPDDQVALTAGLQRLIAGPGPDHDAFVRYNAASSWHANIDGLARLLRRI